MIDVPDQQRDTQIHNKLNEKQLLLLFFCGFKIAFNTSEEWCDTVVKTGIGSCPVNVALLTLSFTSF